MTSRHATTALLAAAVGLLTLVPAIAQDAPGRYPSYPPSLNRITNTLQDPEGEPPVNPRMQAQPPDSVEEEYEEYIDGDGGCAHEGCGRCRRCRGGLGLGLRCAPELNCCEGDPWRLFPCYQQCGDLTINGWLDAGATANFDAPASNYNGTLSFNDRDELQLNQFYLVMEKKADTGGCGWAIGGRADVFWGTDSRFTEARGLETRGDLTNKWSGNSFYGVALPQFYGEVAYNNLSVKLGHFYTIVGYESVMAPGNFFYSHSYTMQYGEPFTHTGALASWNQSDTTTLVLGMDRGWNNWEDDDDDNPAILGGIAWHGYEGLSVALSGTAGKEPTGQGFNDDRWLYSLVVSYDINSRLTYVFQHDCGRQESGSAVTEGADAEWYSINQYLYYKINCCWTAGARFEWFRDDDGFRVAAVGDRTPPSNNPASGGGFQGNFYEITLGANWSPGPNVIVRPEIRWDWFDAGGGATAQPFNDGTSNDQTTAAVDVILKY